MMSNYVKTNMFFEDYEGRNEQCSNRILTHINLSVSFSLFEESKVCICFGLRKRIVMKGIFKLTRCTCATVFKDGFNDFSVPEFGDRKLNKNIHSQKTIQP